MKKIQKFVLGVLFTVLLAVFAILPAYADNTVLVSNLQPDWTSIGGGGVWSAYYGPTGYSAESPGITAVYNGRQAGIIKAGLNMDVDGHYWDEGLFAFKVLSVDISTFASQAFTYDVQNESGPNPVWVRIRLTSGLQYQFVPTTNPAGWHTVDAAAGMWQLMDSNGNATGSLMTLNQVAANNLNAMIDRVYLTLGMGDSYNVSPGVGTVGWIDKVTIGEVTYDFIVEDLVPTDKNQCKDNGWKTFTNPTFKNQGQCVSYVQANEHAGKR